MRRRIGLFALILLTGGPSLAQSATLPPPGMSAAQTRTRLAVAIEKKDTPEVVAAAQLLALMGAGLAEASQATLAPFLSAEQQQDLRDRFAGNVQPIAASSIFAQVPVEHRLVEGIAHDPRTGRLFVGTVVDGELLVGGGLGWRAIQLPKGLGGLFGMRVDAARRRLWIANGTADPVRDKSSITPGLLEIDLDTLAVVDHKAMPAGAQGSPGDIAIGDDGTVYASDGLRGGIYRCKPGCLVLEQLVAPGRLRSPQGMVVSRDGTELIVADYAGGLARINLAGGEIAWMDVRDAAMLDGIDGLMRHEDGLVGIQNGTSPRRIVRLVLSEDEARVDAVEVIERANPTWGEPTLGTIADAKLIYVADGQWEVYGSGGVLNPDQQPRATALRAVALPLR